MKAASAGSGERKSGFRPLLSRRRFIEQTLSALLYSSLLPLFALNASGRKGDLMVKALKKGDRIALVNPAGAVFLEEDVLIAEETLRAMGFSCSRGRHLLARYGYLAGTDEQRAADINEAFADEKISAVLALRGGWGCSRILDRLDYQMIAAHPKILMGYSDITSLLIAVNSRCGFPTFHGPVGISTWNTFTRENFTELCVKGEKLHYQNPIVIPADELVQKQHRTAVLFPGRAEGPLIGGNLSVFCSLVGTPYLGDLKGKILFFEDVGEDIYRIDRMMSQLDLAGILKNAAGMVFGKCSDCGSGKGYGSLTLMEVLEHYAQKAGIPSYYGAMIGHIDDKFTVPLGIRAALDADVSAFRLLEAAVRG